MKTKRRVRLEALALLLAVFVAGALGGAALERRAGGSGGDSPPFFRGPPVGAPGTIPSFYEALDLTEEQRAAIREILGASRPETDSILGVALPRLRELTRSTRDAIRDVLTDEQRAELDERFESERFRGRSRGRGDDRGGRGPGERPR